jgi:hypothetical protein
MSVIGSNILAGASGQGGDYTIARSLRFRSSASAYLNRTPASAGNRQIFTYSTWFKRGTLGTVQTILSVGVVTASNPRVDWQFNASNQLEIDMNSSGTAWDCLLTTTQVFRDPSAWYHVVVAVDTTQATASNRVKVYVNGSQVTSFSSSTYPAQNANMPINNTLPHGIGNYIVGSNQYFDGYLTEVNFIDGQALTPSSFGANNASTGVWQPKKYTGTYGTNGFYLPFTNNSTTTTLGNDFSGNGNNWTTNNISLTAGVTYDSMTDVPTLTSATASNFCVLNPLDISSVTSNDVWSLTNGNLKFNNGPGQTSGAYLYGTVGVSSGKWYFEGTVSTSGTSIYAGVGISTGTTQVQYNLNGDKNVSGTSSAYGATYASGDVIGVALDCNAGTITFYKNNVSQGAISGITGLQIPKYGALQDNLTGSFSSSWEANFGQRPFVYTPPTGFVALNTFNLPTPTIGATASTQANKYFDATLYTGNGSTQSITNSGSMQPDLVFFKNRSATSSPIIQDSIRGTGKVLVSNSTSGDQNITDYITAFNSNGFSVGNGASGAIVDVNANTNAYVGWQWKANGAGSTNTAGSITSTVSANTSAGFSVVTYTPPSSGTCTVGHGLGVAPSMIITKKRNGADNWPVYHASIGAGKIVELNLTSAQSNNTIIGSSAPTSTIFNFAGVGGDWVAYCFSEIAGYSKFGSYTGNGSTDGTFVYTGFRPRYIMHKRTDVGNPSADWRVWDTARNQFNAADALLFPNSSMAEAVNPAHNIDILSNGFKFRTSDSNVNGSGAPYIFMAFCESPFKYANAR